MYTDTLKYKEEQHKTPKAHKISLRENLPTTTRSRPRYLPNYFCPRLKQNLIFFPLLFILYFYIKSFYIKINQPNSIIDSSWYTVIWLSSI